MSVPDLKFESDSSNRSKIIRGSQNFERGSRDPKPRPLMGRFVVRSQQGSILDVCAKCEADASIRSKL